MVRTYVHDEEVQPAPGVGEVGLEAVGHPLQQHLHDEHVGEHLVRVLQDRLDDAPLLQVDVLEGLDPHSAPSDQTHTDQTHTDQTHTDQTHTDRTHTDSDMPPAFMLEAPVQPC